MTNHERITSDKELITELITYWYCHSTCQHRHECKPDSTCVSEVVPKDIIRKWLDSEC